MEAVALNKRVFEIPEKLYSGNVSEIQKQIEYNLLKFKSIIIKITNLKEVDIAGVFMLYLVLQFAKNKQLEVSFLGLDNRVFNCGLSLCGLKHVFA